MPTEKLTVEQIEIYENMFGGRRLHAINHPDSLPVGKLFETIRFLQSELGEAKENLLGWEKAANRQSVNVINLARQLSEKEKEIEGLKRDKEGFIGELLEWRKKSDDFKAEVERLTKESDKGDAFFETTVNSYKIQLSSLRSRLSEAYQHIWNKVYLDTHFPIDFMDTVLSVLKLGEQK
jgi:hypothetical protein